MLCPSGSLLRMTENPRPKKEPHSGGEGLSIGRVRYGFVGHITLGSAANVYKPLDKTLQIGSHTLCPWSWNI